MHTLIYCADAYKVHYFELIQPESKYMLLFFILHELKKMVQ